MGLKKLLKNFIICWKNGFILVLFFYTSSGFSQSLFFLPTPITDLTGLLELFTDEILVAAEELELRTGVEVKILSAYRFAPDSPFGIESQWSALTSGTLLFVINTHEDAKQTNWVWAGNVKIFVSQNIVADFPVSLRDQTLSNIMIPILDGLPDRGNKVYGAPEKYAQAIIQALGYMADALEGPYFLISDRKYYSGGMAYLGQAEDEAEELAAYHADGTPFPTSSSWAGVTDGSGHIASFSVNAHSATSAGDPVSISYDNAGSAVELAIHIVVVKVTFKKHPDQVYGFDDNPSFTNSNGNKFCYPFYNTSPPKDGIPWKSVEVGKSDAVIAEILPEGVGNKVFLVSDTPEFFASPDAVSTSEISFAVQAGLENAEGLISALLGQEDGLPGGWLRLVSFPEIIKRVFLIEVYNAEIDPVSQDLLPQQADMNNQINSLYREGVIKLDIGFDILDNIYYDIMPQNVIEVPDETGDYSPEMISIFNNCLICNDLMQQFPPVKFIFIVDLPPVKKNGNPYDIKGRFKMNENFGFIFTKNIPPPEISNIITHELGHGVFDLKHPFQEFDPGYDSPCLSNYTPFALDEFNIMDYGAGIPQLFRRYYWSKMH